MTNILHGNQQHVVLFITKHFNVMLACQNLPRVYVQLGGTTRNVTPFFSLKRLDSWLIPDFVLWYFVVLFIFLHGAPHEYSNGAY
jgi:hypothetical protein